MNRALKIGVVLIFAAMTVPGSQNVRGADTLFNSKPLMDLVTTEAMAAHLQAVEDIYVANGAREFGTLGFKMVLDYAQQRLTATKYFDVSRRSFTYPFFTNLNPPELEQISPVPTTYVAGTDMTTATFSGSGEKTAEVVPIDVVVPANGLPETAFTSGCTASDFASVNVTNKIALIQRGTCPFLTKVTNAINAGAISVLLFNIGNTSANSVVFTPSVASPVAIPVMGTSYAIGADIVNKTRDGFTLFVRMKTDTITELRNGEYLLAETRKGDPGKVILVNVGVDAVQDSPTISAATGFASNLEIAEKLRYLAPPRNKVRFFFGNDAGNVAYRDSLSDQEYQRIAAVLGGANIGSPNFVRGVMDGDHSSLINMSSPPDGSGLIENIYLEYFNGRQLPTEPLPSGAISTLTTWGCSEHRLDRLVGCSRVRRRSSRRRKPPCLEARLACPTTPGHRRRPTPSTTST